MKLCWLIPDNRGGGIAPVAASCCTQAAYAGHEATLLFAFPSTVAVVAEPNFQIASLQLAPPATDAPIKLTQWLDENPQDVLLLNGCEETDAAIAYLPANTKCVYVVHDTASRYWETAVEEEEDLNGIVAVSHAVAANFQYKLKQPDKLRVIHNGSKFPNPPKANQQRHDDLIFLGGSNSMKGAFDVLNVWRELVSLNFAGRLHWFGDIEPHFQPRIAELPEVARIHIYGGVAREIIFSIAASAKVLLLLSRAESFGMATIEGMSMGCVPIAWDINTGTAEIVTRDKTGLLAPLGDTAALARQVIRGCEDYDAFGTAVMKHARESFNATVMWHHYETFLKHLCTLQPLVRSKSGQVPAPFTPPTRYFQLLPSIMRSPLRNLIGRHPRLGYWLRDFRGR